MKHPPFLIGEALAFGWKKTQAHSRVLFFAMLSLFALQIASSIVDKVLHDTVRGSLAMLALAVVNVAVTAGFTLIALKIAKGERVSYENLAPQGRLVWRYFCVSILTGFLTALGLVLLIVPGLYLLLRFSMTRLAVLDGDGVMESLSTSADMTKGVKWQLLRFLLVLLCLNILGAAALLVGLLITVPVSAIAYSHVYLKLKVRS